MPAQVVGPMIEPSGNICGGTSSYVPSGGGCGCGGGTEPSGNICGGTSSYVPSGGGCGCGGGSTQAATEPSGNICGGTSSFTPAGDSCRCSPCISKRMQRGAGNKFPGVRRVGTDLEDPRGKMFIPSPPATDKRRKMLPNGGGVAQVIPTRTAEPVRAQGAAVPAMIPAATTKPTDLGAGPATNAVMMEGKKADFVGGLTTTVPLNLAGQDLVQWTAPDYCADDRIAATELCRQGGDQQLSDICRVELRAWIASGDKTPLAQWVASRELCSGELQRLLGLVEDVKNSAGLWPVYEASGAPMSNPRGVLSIDELPFGASVFVDGMRVNLEYTHRDQTYGIAWAQEGVHTIMVVDQKGNIRSVKALITRQERPIRYSSMARGQRFGSSGAPMALGGSTAVIQPMRFANPSKPSFVPGMGMARASGGMYRPSGDSYDDAFAEGGAATSDLDWNRQLLRDTADPAADGGKGDSGGKDFGTPARREPSTTDYIRSIGGVATAALDGISRTIGQQADIRLRQLMAANADTANARAEANRTLQIELAAGIQRAQIAATAAAGTAGGGARVAQLEAEIRAMTEAQTRSAVLAQTNAPPSTPLVTSSTRTDEGLSTGAKVGIGVGAVAVLGLGAYLVMRKR
jgi:hypothetical protein